MASEDKKTLLLIDSHALIHRAYHAFPPTLIAPDGSQINAVYGFANLLIEVLLKFKPTHVVAVMDSAGPTIRQTNFAQYKANRGATDDELISQFPKVEELLGVFDIPVLRISGYEADDIIGTIDTRHSGVWAQTVIVTGDKDLFQLVDEDTFVYLAGSSFSQSKLYNTSMVIEKMGVGPENITDYKGLCGDPSDNIPGVRGIGPKSAVELISKFGNVEGVYQNILDVPSKYQAKLIENQELAILSKNLATIDRDVPISFDFDLAGFNSIELNKIRDFFKNYNFKSLIGRLESLAKIYAPAEEMNLFQQSLIKPVTNIVDWKGEDLRFKNIYFLSEIEDLKSSPLKYKFKTGYFVDGNSSEKIYRFEKEYLKDFIKIISKIESFSFEVKAFLHAIRNEGYSIESLPIKDIGYRVVLMASGKCSYSLKSILNCYGYEYPEQISDSLVPLKDIHITIEGQLDKEPKMLDLISLEDNIMMLILNMEQNGIIVDKDMFSFFEQKLQEKLNRLKSDIYNNVGHEFNINSPKQVGQVLFEEKKLSSVKKTKSGAYSTDESTLRKLTGIDPIIEMLLEHREIDKLLSTYVNVLPSYVDSFDNRIHATFDQLGAVSGRFSSKNPNLQNIPKDEVQNINIRKAFIASKDSIFISFDYSQQELRILAALAKEEDMINSFNTDKDIHILTASELFDIKEDEVGENHRKVGKTVNFSVIYGISSFGLSERLKLSRQEAGLFIDKYFKRYKSVKLYLDNVLNEIRQRGYSETVLGRRRINEMINSNNKNLRSAAERELFNFIIQGSAADIMKSAMRTIKSILPKYSANLLLQIHDEFLFEYKFGKEGCTITDNGIEIVKNSELDHFIKDMHSAMINAYDIGVKYQVECSVGTRWGEMKKIKLLKE